MYKIINTTDKKFIGREIKFDTQKIMLGDFIFIIEKIQYLQTGEIELSNPNYIIKIKQVNNL